MRVSTSVAVISVIFSQLSSAQSTINMATLRAWKPSSPVQGEEVNALGLAFYLGASGPATYCPIDPASCPPGNETVVYRGGMSLSVEVPGGQQTYVAPSGAIGYTQAHSTSMPAGSYVGGFTSYTTLDGNGVNRTVINWETPGDPTHAGILACPHVPSNNDATYQIYGRTPEFSQTDCIELKGLLSVPQPNNDIGAWQYT